MKGQVVPTIVGADIVSVGAGQRIDLYATIDRFEHLEAQADLAVVRLPPGKPRVKLLKLPMRGINLADDATSVWIGTP